MGQSRLFFSEQWGQSHKGTVPDELLNRKNE